MGRKLKKAEAFIEPELSQEKLDRLAEIEELRQEKPTIQIVSATLRDNMFASYVYNHNLGNDIANEVKTKSDLPVHEDFKTAMGKLNPHFAIICEEIDPAEIDDIDDGSSLPDGVECLVVQSMKIVGKIGEDGVILSGYKLLKSGEHLQLEAPKIKFGSEKYPFVKDLIIHTYNLIDETIAYMGGKRAPQVQQDLFDEAETYAEEAV